MRLSQVVALDSGKRTGVTKALTDLHRKTAKADLFQGSHRSFTSTLEGEVEQPPESKRVQLTFGQAIDELREVLGDWYDAVVTKDAGNLQENARADVKVGTFEVTGLPIPTLLFFEKQLEDLRKFVESLPILDPAYNWSWDENEALFRTDPTKVLSTRKVNEVIVLYPATTEHPAQTKLEAVDKPVGYWTKVSTSGAISGDQKRAFLQRINRLSDAFKIAREEANSVKVEEKKVAQSLFDYIFSDI